MTNPKSLIIGADHAGFNLKEGIKRYFEDKLAVTDEGTQSTDSVDYPVYAGKVAKQVLSNSDSLGVLVCGSGIGMSIAANKIKGIRAALCPTAHMAKLAREHNNANILVLPGREPLAEDPMDIVQTFLDTPFSGEERHLRRLAELED